MANNPPKLLTKHNISFGGHFVSVNGSVSVGQLEVDGSTIKISERWTIPIITGIRPANIGYDISSLNIAKGGTLASSRGLRIDSDTLAIGVGGTAPLTLKADNVYIASGITTQATAVTIPARMTSPDTTLSGKSTVVSGDVTMTTSGKNILSKVSVTGDVLLPSSTTIASLKVDNIVGKVVTATTTNIVGNISELTGVGLVQMTGVDNKSVVTRFTETSKHVPSTTSLGAEELECGLIRFKADAQTIHNKYDVIPTHDISLPTQAALEKEFSISLVVGAIFKCIVVNDTHYTINFPGAHIRICPMSAVTFTVVKLDVGKYTISAIGDMGTGTRDTVTYTGSRDISADIIQIKSSLNTGKDIAIGGDTSFNDLSATDMKTTSLTCETVDDTNVSVTSNVVTGRPVTVSNVVSRDILPITAQYLSAADIIKTLLVLDTPSASVINNRITIYFPDSVSYPPSVIGGVSWVSTLFNNTPYEMIISVPNVIACPIPFPPIDAGGSVQYMCYNPLDSSKPLSVYPLGDFDTSSNYVVS